MDRVANVQVKKALTGEPLFYTPNFPLPFILQTDASNTGQGDVFSQQVRAIDQPILYISRKLTDWERRYSMVEKECLAICGRSTLFVITSLDAHLLSDHGPRATAMAPKHERYQSLDHPVLSGFTAL